MAVRNIDPGGGGTKKRADCFLAQVKWIPGSTGHNCMQW